ncbi:MAG: SDR family NAD(P)-dependent oxidoreductase, partial [Acidimicrobiales bacterium]
MCEGRVCIVTGAGRGIGREYALMLAAEGAKVVVNDLGGSRDGEGGDAGPAQQVVDEIKTAGGEAIANTDDISKWAGGETIVRHAIDTFGGLDVVVNNAGIVRDRMLFSMTGQEWDAVIKVHLKGTFTPSRHAARYWRDRAKAGETNDARIIDTTSVAGLYANPGQTNYAAAKSGIATFTQVAAQELVRYGVTVNAIAPGALTRLTDDLGLPEETLA